MLAHLVTLYLEQRSYFGIVVRISLARVECYNITGLNSVEQLLLIVYLNV